MNIAQVSQFQVGSEQSGSSTLLIHTHKPEFIGPDFSAQVSANHPVLFRVAQADHGHFHQTQVRIPDNGDAAPVAQVQGIGNRAIHTQEVALLLDQSQAVESDIDEVFIRPHGPAAAVIVSVYVIRIGHLQRNGYFIIVLGKIISQSYKGVHFSVFQPFSRLVFPVVIFGMEKELQTLVLPEVKIQCFEYGLGISVLQAANL